MTNILLAWHAAPSPRGTNVYPNDLSDPDAVVRLFRQASRFRATITAEGWRFLWAHFGLEGLIDINRQAGWFDTADDREAAEQIVCRSLIEGYDPASKRLRGSVEAREETFSYHGRLARA